MSIRFREDRQKWEWSGRVHGKRVRRLFQSKQSALQAGSGDVVEGQESITIDEAVKGYFSAVSTGKSVTSKKNERLYFNLMNAYLEADEGLRYLNQIKYRHMVGLQNWLGKPKTVFDRPMVWTPQTVNRAFNSIKHFFAYWVRDGELDASPCAHLEQLAAKENARRPMTLDEFKLAFACADEWFKPIMLFVHLTAAAPSSVVRLRWADIKAESIVITRRKGSKGQWREISMPMSDALKVLIVSQPRRHELVFSGEHGRPISASWVSRMGNRAIRAAGLKGVTLYSMRHALATDLTNKNVSLEIVRQLLGHSNIRTTQRYASPSQETLVNALRLVR